jgi:formamidopyrimidine-DNA glycosylase
LMDQQRIAGLGNIYAAEALHRARVNPRRAIASVRRDKITALHGAIVAVLTDAVDSAVRAYAGPGELGEAESFSCAVYGREASRVLLAGGRFEGLPRGDGRLIIVAGASGECLVCLGVGVLPQRATCGRAIRRITQGGRSTYYCSGCQR